jgi:TonB family protein
LNPGAGAAIQADYSVNLEGPDTAGDIKKMIFEMGEVDKLPEPIQQVDPQYPPKLFAARVGGTVTAVFVVDEQGNVRDITIREGAHYELGRAVTQALARWKWRPGTKNGEPVMVRFIKPFEFDPRAR